MKVSYATTFDLRNSGGWPKRHLGLYGAGARIIQVLKQESIEVECLGIIERKRSPITRLKWLFYHHLYKKDFYSWADPIVSRHYAHQIEAQLASSNADILLCLENAIPLAMVRPDRPMVLWTDTTLGSLIDFYPYLSNLCAETKNNLLRMEKRVLERCSLLVVNSDWAARKAQELYGISQSKVEVIPRVSTQTQHLSESDIEMVIEQRKGPVCRLLFMGVEWHRKGGDVAFGVAQALTERGIETELHVVGCMPPVDLPDFVKVHGFVDRRTLEGKAQIDRLFRETHFLLYPTKADALGMVMSEAGAYGVPTLATQVGGISSLVKSHMTGETFSVDSDPSDYCRFVIPYITDMNRYQSLARSTVDYYRNYASWPAVGRKAQAVLSRLL